jgi:dihydroxyacetone kinase-like predicted kinase
VHPLPEGRQGHQGRLTALLDGAIAHLERHRAQVNELNVFPVADGDTGDNLLATLCAFRDGGSQGALMGARGNSGVILSQLLAGLAEGGPAEAVRRAYAAVPEPVEGTMLTVARDMAAAEDLQQALLLGRESLARGPALLPALREAGVLGDGATLRAHVHTDDPDAVVALFGDVLDLDVSDMWPRTTAFALADGGFEDLVASMGVRTAAEVAPVDADCVFVVAEPQAALVASVAFDQDRTPQENSAALLEAIARVRTASVPAGGELGPALAGLAGGAELLTIITGPDAPLTDEEIRALAPPGVEVEVTPGAPPPWWWLIAAE